MWKANLLLALTLCALLMGLRAALDKYDNTPLLISAVMARNEVKCSACYAAR